MSEHGWTHLDPSEHEPEADPNAEAEKDGYAIDETALDPSPEMTDEEIEEEAEGEGEEIEAPGPSVAARAQALLAGVGKGASLGLQAIGRMNPRTRIGVASGLSVLALAGAFFTRDSGSKPAPTAQVGGNQAAQKPENQPEPRKAKQDDIDAMKAEKEKAEKEAIAATTPPTSEPKKEDADSKPHADPLAEKPPELGTADMGTVLAANSEPKEKSGLDASPPLPNPGAPEPASKSAAEPPLPPIGSPGDSGDSKPHGDPKPSLPTAEPASGGHASAAAPESAPPLPPIGDSPDKIAAPAATASSAAPPAVELPLPAGAAAPTAAAPAAAAAATALAVEALKTESEKKEPPKDTLEKKDSGKDNPQPPQASPENAPPVLPVAEKPTDPTPSPTAKASEPTLPDPAKVEPQGLPPVASTPAPTMVEPNATPPAESPKPQRADAMPSAPKELPKATVEAAAGALAVGGAAAATAAAITPDEKKPPEPKSDPANDPNAVPIRNSKMSQPRDLNSADDPRGDESQGLFDSGPETSAVSPSTIDTESRDEDRRFEVESPPPKTQGRIVQAESQPRPDRVEVAYHKVERGENFWTISNLFYGSGRYYKALWAANRGTVPAVDQLRVNQVIVIPAQEDLDSSLIAPEKVMTASGSGGSRSVSGRSSSRGPKSLDSSSRKSLAASGIDPISDDDDSFATRGRSKGKSATRERDIDDGLDRVSNTSDDRSTDLPIHKVRARETLRSIARDRLGDSKRAGEILRLNRGIIDDPSNLVVGQVIELPEDAKPGRR